MNLFLYPIILGQGNILISDIWRKFCLLQIDILQYIQPLHFGMEGRTHCETFLPVSFPPSQETFVAEVEVMRMEMKSCDLTVEGEFWSEEKMYEEGYSEYLDYMWWGHCVYLQHTCIMPTTVTNKSLSLLKKCFPVPISQKKHNRNPKHSETSRDPHALSPEESPTQPMFENETYLLGWWTFFPGGSSTA